MRIFQQFLLLLTFSLSFPVYSTEIVNINYDGSAYTEIHSGDSTLNIGETYQLNFMADTNDYWTNMMGATFWPAQYMIEDANRTGTWSWDYMLGGSLVSSGSRSGDSSAKHILQYVDTFSGMFDLLTIDYTLTASTASGNTLDVGVHVFSNVPFTATYINNPSAVPAPATLTLLSLGLAALRFTRRKAINN